MKIAMIDFHGDLISQEDGSAQKVIKSFASNLTFNVSCISRSSDGKYKESIVDKVKYYAIPENRLKNKIANKILNLKVFTYEKMIPIINKEKFDILHFHNRFELVDKLVNNLNYKPKIICHFHREFNHPIIPKSADLILGVSKSLSEYLKQKSTLNKTFDYIHNPIPYDVFNFESKKAKQTDKLKLLFAFGENKRKGFEEIIEAVKILENNHIDYELNICGNKTPLQFDNKKIITHGFLNHTQLYKLMQENNVYLLPSYSEGLPMSILESVYFGMFVIPSKVGGIPEIFGKDYELYCELNGKSIVEKIQIVQNYTQQDIEKYNKLREYILTKFSAKYLAKELEKKYKELNEKNNISSS